MSEYFSGTISGSEGCVPISALKLGFNITKNGLNFSFPYGIRSGIAKEARNQPKEDSF